MPSARCARWWLAAALLQDAEWWVRLAAVGNAPSEFLAALADDPEVEIREAVAARLAEETARHQGSTR